MSTTAEIINNVRATIAKLEREMSSPTLRGENYVLFNVDSGFPVMIVGERTAKVTTDVTRATRWTEKHARTAVTRESHLNLQARKYLDVVKEHLDSARIVLADLASVA
jgi:hypothetical protein